MRLSPVRVIYQDDRGIQQSCYVYQADDGYFSILRYQRLRPIVEVAKLRGWGCLDGPAAVYYIACAEGRYLIPAE